MSRKQLLLFLGGVVVVVAVVLGVVKTFTGGHPGPEPELSSSFSAGPAMSQASLLDATSGSAGMAGASDESQLDAGYATYGALERTAATTVYLAAERTSGSTGVAITRAAAMSLCPEHGTAVEALTAAVAP